MERTMDKDRVKGKAKDVAGRVERQMGEWTGDEKKQAEGAAEQVKGKVQNVWGKAKDTGRDAMKDMKRSGERDMEPERPAKKRA